MLPFNTPIHSHPINTFGNFFYTQQLHYYSQRTFFNSRNFSSIIHCFSYFLSMFEFTVEWKTYSSFPARFQSQSNKNINQQQMRRIAADVNWNASLIMIFLSVEKLSHQRKIKCQNGSTISRRMPFGYPALINVFVSVIQITFSRHFLIFQENYE